jgi:hypothetical protein
MAALTTPLLGQTRQSSERSYPMPKTLTLNHGTLPTWAEASVVLLENGEPNPAVWGDRTARIREILEEPADDPIYYNGKIIAYSGSPSAPGCRDVGISYYDIADPLPRATLEDAVTHSEVALLGRVTDKAYGFYGSDPGQLLQIEPIRSYGYTLSKPRYYFFVPIGRFRIDGVEICKTDQRYAEPPAIGGEVFLFEQRPADRSGVLLEVLDPGDVVPVDPGGSLRLPRQYAVSDEAATRRASAARTKSDLLAQIQNLRAPDLASEH